MEHGRELLQKKREKYVAKAIFQLTNLDIVKAKGAKLWDADGKEYIDFVGGIGCVNAGHNPDSVVKAVQDQANAYLHPSINIVNYKPYIDVAEMLCNITPGKHEKQAALFNSGAEAVENAVKIARLVTKRSAIISFDAAFHGRTLLSMTLTSKIKPYKYGYGPYAPEVYHIPHPALTKIENIDEYWQKVFGMCISAKQVAAIIFEPELGEGGFLPMPKKFLNRMADICRNEEILLIADEVQTGFCRTGKLFAIEHYNVIPDLMLLGKSIASGMPLSAVVGKKQLMDASHVGGLGGTFAGNPVSCRAAIATIKLYDELGLAERAQAIGSQVKSFFTKLQQKYSCIGDIHGLGAMVGISFINKKGEPSAKNLTALMSLASQKGLVLMSSGMHGNIMRTLMPLVITDKELQTAFAIVENCLEELNLE